MDLFALTPVGSLDQKARSMIDNVFPAFLKHISYNVKSSLPYEIERLTNENETPDGAYDNDTKTIYLHKNSTIETALHEIGHAVHYQIFNAEKFNLSAVNKSDRACVNHKEDFAEAFMYCVLTLYNNGSLEQRDKQIVEILKAV